MWWIAKELQPYRRQREVAKGIERLGGKVHWMIDFPRVESTTQAWLRRLLGEELFAYPEVVEIYNGEAMQYLAELGQPHVLTLVGAEVTNENLEYVRKLTELQSIALLDMHVTDDGMRPLLELKHLQVLWIEGAPVTDAGIDYIQEMTQLRDVILIGTQVADAGLVKLSNLKQLNRLVLKRSSITDAGLDCLKDCTELRELNIMSTGVSDDAITRLQQALPNCQIIH